jgi:3-hydroxybutyrate dehydrogenase
MALNGKNVLVTGSSNGLGLAMATALAASGCNIVLHGLEPAQSVEQTTAELASSYDVSVSYVRADLSTVEGVDALVETARARVGSIDVLINNAVVRHFARIESFALEHWHRALAVNLTAAFRAIQLTLPGMRERGWGRIFNMTSVCMELAQRLIASTTLRRRLPCSDSHGRWPLRRSIRALRATRSALGRC